MQTIDASTWLSQAAVEKLGWVLVHSFWQLTAIALLAWLLQGTDDDLKRWKVDESAIKEIRQSLPRFQLLWVDTAQFDELRRLIPDHEFEDQHKSSMVFLDSDGSWLCHFSQIPRRSHDGRWRTSGLPWICIRTERRILLHHHKGELCIWRAAGRQPSVQKTGCA